MFKNIRIPDVSRQALVTAAQKRRLPHAIVLEGTDAQNRAIAAVAVAKALVCSGNIPPCDNCDNCRKADSGSHPDIIVLSKPEKKANYLIDDVRKVKTQAYIVPNEANRKVYIFSEVQYLNVACQNTILKLIEEPPAHAVFIMTCPSASCLLETVRSRSQTFSLGDATDVSSSQDDESICPVALNLAQLLCEGNEAAFMWETAAFEKDKQLFTDALAGLGICLRDAIVLKNGGNVIMGDKDTAVLLSRTFSAFVLTNMAQRVTALTAQLKSNINNNLAITRLSSELFGAKLS